MKERVTTPGTDTEVLDKRESASRPHAGLVTVRTRTINQEGTEVLSFHRTFYVYRADSPQLADRFPTAKTSIEVGP